MFLERPPFLPGLADWFLAFIPFLALVVLIMVGWSRLRPGQRAESWT